MTKAKEERGCDEREGEQEAMGGGLVEREKTRERERERERESDINEKLEI